MARRRSTSNRSHIDTMKGQPRDEFIRDQIKFSNRIKPENTIKEVHFKRYRDKNVEEAEYNDTIK